METNELVLLELFNHQDEPQTVFIEPWGDEFKMPKGELWRLVSVGRGKGTPSISFFENGTAVYGVGEVLNRLYSGDSILWESSPWPTNPS